MPPISLGKGPVPICPPDNQVKNFFNKIGTTVEIRSEKLSKNFWATSGIKYLVSESQTPGGLNEQGVKELRRSGFYKSLEKSLNSILKRLNKA